MAGNDAARVDQLERLVQMLRAENEVHNHPILNRVCHYARLAAAREVCVCVCVCVLCESGREKMAAREKPDRGLDATHWLKRRDAMVAVSSASNSMIGWLLVRPCVLLYGL
jgi:hypothetical protein